MKKPQYIALAVMVLIAVWMFFPRSAPSTDDSSEGNSIAAIVALPADAQVTDESINFVVRVAVLRSQPYEKDIRVRGRTQAFRTVDVRAEQSGRVVATPAVRGSRVNTGDVLCEIAVDTRAADLAEAESRREQTLFEYTAIQDLRKQGLVSAVSESQAKASYDSSLAAVERASLALANIRMRAPFAGVVETRPVEIGDLLERGGVCASVLDDSPMLLVGLVPENDIGSLELGAPVKANLLGGEQLGGKVSYLSRDADSQSRSYRMEAEITSLSSEIRAGISAEILIAASEIQAHLIPASALNLDDNGNIGVKVLNGNNVAFLRVEVVGDEATQLNSGIWVTGLPEQVNLITHGQEIVFAGQTVQSNVDWSTGSR